MRARTDKTFWQNGTRAYAKRFYIRIYNSKSAMRTNANAKTKKNYNKWSGSYYKCIKTDAQASNKKKTKRKTVFNLMWTLCKRLKNLNDSKKLNIWTTTTSTYHI